ncbi:hypothetical protein GOP47_0024194, partial [Adiantum capillus-veneris]
LINFSSSSNSKFKNLNEQTRKEAAEWEARALGKEELVKENVEAQRQILLLQTNLQWAKSVLWERARTLLSLKRSAFPLSSWRRYLDLCRKRKVLKRAERIWNHKVMGNWFSSFQHALLTLRKRRQILRICLLRLKKRTLLQSVIHWQSWTSRKKALSQAYARLVQLKEWRLLRKSTIHWEIVCCKTLYQKTQKKKAAMVSRRCQLQKAWKSWSSTCQASSYYRDVAREHYAREKLDCLFVRWKLYSAKQACRQRHALSSAQQRATFLMKLSFSGWLDMIRHCLMVQERLVAFQLRGHFKLKKNLFQFLLHMAFRNIEKRNFRLSLRSKNKKLVKERVLACFSHQTSQRRLLNKFLLLQSSKRRLNAFSEWRLRVIYQHWVWAKRKRKDIFMKKHTFIAWMFYLEMSRTHAAYKNVQHLEGRLSRTLLELKELKNLKLESKKLYSLLETENSYARKKFRRIANNLLPMLEARLQWTVVPQGGRLELSPRVGHSSVKISCTLGTEVSSFIAIFGGYDGTKAFGDVFCFDTGSAFPRPAWNHTACSYKNKMIIFGGFDGCLQSSEVSILSFSNNDSCSWSQPRYSMGASPSPLSQHTCCLYGEGRYMVVFGGYSACKGHLNELWILDLHCMSWTSPECFGTQPSPRRGHGAAVVRNKMYIFGGFDGTSHLCDVQVLDLQSWTWTHLCTQGSGPIPRRHHALEAVGDHLVVYGGYDGVTYLEDVYSLDISANIWRCLNPLKPHTNAAIKIGGVGTKFARSLHTMTLDTSRLVIFGGVYENGSLQDTLFLENAADVQGAHMENLLLEEVAKGVNLQKTLQGCQELLEKRSKQVVKLGCRASQLEEAFKEQQTQKEDLINKNRLLKRKLVKARKTFDNFASSYPAVGPALG